MVGEPGRQYVALLIDPTTGEIEAHGPVTEPLAVVLADELQAALAIDAELREIGVLILPLRPPTSRCGSPCGGRLDSPTLLPPQRRPTRPPRRRSRAACSAAVNGLSPSAERFSSRWPPRFD